MRKFNFLTFFRLAAFSPAFAISCCLFALVLLSGYSAFALPSEGLEAFGLGKSKTKLTLLNTHVGYINPVWFSDYQTMQVYISTPVLGDNYLSSGFSTTASNKFADRSAYFLRYDQTFHGQSISLKLLHIDEKFLNTGKNIISSSYNAAIAMGKATTLYFSMGLYYRFNLNRWNTPTWNPVNFNTEDKEYYFEGVFGFKRMLGQSNFLTIDMNNRDAFNSYNGDFVALDVGLNFLVGQKSYLRIANSLRFSAFFMGTADIGQESLFLGLVTEL